LNHGHHSFRCFGRAASIDRVEAEIVRSQSNDTRYRFDPDRNVLEAVGRTFPADPVERGLIEPAAAPPLVALCPASSALEVLAKDGEGCDKGGL
jgi:hypothetical protein